MTKNEKNFIYFQTLHINVKYKKKREIFRENLLDKHESYISILFRKSALVLIFNRGSQTFVEEKSSDNNYFSHVRMQLRRI